MTIERKVLVLKDAAVDVESGGSGTGSGYGAIFGNRDLGGDIIEPGFFAGVLEEFLSDGFMSWAHRWDVPVAWPTEAKEDKIGLALKWAYHSTPTAQEARTITAERLAAGKRMGLSIGYEVAEEKQKPDGRHLIRAERLFEVGHVLVPMNPVAGVSEAKSLVVEENDLTPYDPALRWKAGAVEPHETATSDEAWDATVAEAALAETAEALAGAAAWVDAEGDPDTKSSYRFLHHEVKDDGTPGPANLAACLDAIAVLNGAAGGPSIPPADREGVHRHLAKHLTDAEREAPALKSLRGGTYTSQSDYVLSELAGWRDRTVDLLRKEGRAISESRRTRLTSHVGALEAVLSDLRGLLDETAPPEKQAAWALRARAQLATARAELGLFE